MRAKFSTSCSVSFGLLSTAIDTSLLGSRIRMPRSSRVPRMAAFTLSVTLSNARRCTVATRLRWSRRCRRPTRRGRDLEGLLPGVRRLRVSGACQQRIIERRRRMAVERRLRRRCPARRRTRARPPARRSGPGNGPAPCRESAQRSPRRRTNPGIAVGGQEHEQRQLFVRARRQDSLGREHPQVVRHFAAPEHVEQRRRVQRVHAGLQHEVLVAVERDGRGHDLAAGAERSRRLAVERHRQRARVAGRP